MAKASPAFQFYPSDWLSDAKVSIMTLEEEGAYIRLLSYCWKEGSIPNDIEILAKLCRVSTEKMESIWKTLCTCFAPAYADEEKLINLRLEKEREKQKKFSKQKSKAAKTRWSKEKSGDARALQVQSKCNAFHSHSLSSDHPPTPQGDQEGEEKSSLKSKALVADFKSLLKASGKDVFPEKWEEENLAICDKLLNQGKTPEEIDTCMRWCAAEAKAKSIVNHFKHVEKYWNVWVSEKGNTMKQAKPFIDKLREAKKVKLENGEESVELSGLETQNLQFDKLTNLFNYNGKEFITAKIIEA